MAVPYMDGELEYDVSWMPLWDWCRGVMVDKGLQQHLVWDARKLFKYDGDNWERFIDEPYTADAWWDFQVSIIICFPT